MFATLIDVLPATFRRSRVLKGEASRSRPGIGFMDVGNCVVRYRVAGEGRQTVVFGADPPVLIEHYDALIDALSETCRVIVFELPGFGFSLPKYGFRFEFDDCTRCVETFLERAGQAPYVLVFPCMAGFSAVRLANRRPNLVKSLVLAQTPDWNGALQWKTGRDPKNVLGKPGVGQLMMHAAKRKRLGQWFGTALGDTGRVAEFESTALWGIDHGACFCLASAFQHYISGSSPAFSPVRQDAVIVWGDRDRSHARTDKNSTRRLAPNAREIVFEGAGHFPDLEEPERFAGVVRELVAR